MDDRHSLRRGLWSHHGFGLCSLSMGSAEGDHTIKSHECKFYLTQQITYLRKEPGTSLIEHLCKFNGLYNNLASIGRPMANKMKAFSLLNNLGTRCEPFTMVMLKPLMPFYVEIIQLLQGYEIRTSLHDLASNPSFALYG